MFDKNSVEKILNYKFKDAKLAKTAFVHSSYANENSIESNERLEYLGDAVLEFVVSDMLYKKFNLPEGELTKYRASLVSETTLAAIVELFGLDKFLLRGKGEAKSQVSSSTMCDLFEAVVGAMYLDGGIDAVKKFVDMTHESLVKNLEINGLEDNAKSHLQEMLKGQRIVYQTTKSGQDHSPTYKSTVFIGGQKLGFGEAKNKRNAEQIAAKNTINMIKKA